MGEKCQREKKKKEGNREKRERKEKKEREPLNDEIDLEKGKVKRGLLFSSPQYL